MAQIITDNQNYIDIANAIREKKRNFAKYAPEEMAAAISSINAVVKKPIYTLDLTKMPKTPSSWRDKTGVLTIRNTEYVGQEAFTDVSKEQNGSIKCVISGGNIDIWAKDGCYLANESVDLTYNNYFSRTNVCYMNFDYLDTSRITNMSGMFIMCLTPVLDLSAFDTSNVTNIKAVFNGSKAQEIIVSNMDTSKVTDMTGAFNSCPNIVTLDLSSWDTSKVYANNCKEMFLGCEKLKTVYCRTEKDKQKFSEDNPPSTINFIVGKPTVEGGK